MLSVKKSWGLCAKVELIISYTHKKSYKEVIETEEELLPILKLSYQKNQERYLEDYIKSLNNLSYFYYELEKKNEALSMLKEAYEIARKHFGEEHNNTRNSRKNYLYVKDELEK